MTGFPCVETWFLGFMQLLCHDSVLLLCRDNVMTEVSLSRPRWSQQEVRCWNRFGLRQGFYVATKCFYVAIEFGQDQEFLCRDKIFLCLDRVSQGEENSMLG